MIKSILFLLLTLLLGINYSSAQGCSDPGFCTTGSLGQLPTKFTAQPLDSLNGNKRMHSYRITESVGVGEDNVKIITSYLDVYLQLHERIQFQIRGPIQMARTKETKTVSLGDIFLINTIKALEKDQHALQVNVGVKLPTNQSNLTYKDSILPMVYQTSLGTFDALLGITYTWMHRLGNLSGGFAYQQPFLHINHNKAPETKEFRRKADILTRVDQVFNIKKKVDLGIGLLYIYHVKNDTRLDAMENRVEIEGSKGTTLNITGLLNWYASKSFELGASFGVPLVTREAKPDGLTRKFVVNPYVQFNF